MILKNGDENTKVALWQAFLVKRGFELTADARFGPKTEAATRAFQNSVGLRGDGIAGPMTFAEAKRLGFAGFPVSDEKPKDATGDKLILVSAGHTNVAGRDRGVASGSYIEGVEAVRLRDSIAALIREHGVSAIEDGADNVNYPLSEALVLARRADIAVEIHFNAGSSAATGIEVLCKPAKKALAQKLAKAIGDATGIKLRGEGGWKSDSSGQHHRLAFCEAGGLIIEICFMTNPSDMEAYTKNFEQVAANLANVLAAA